MTDSNDEKLALLKQQIIEEAVRIPGSEYGLHPAVPVRLFRRSVKAQRPSPLGRLKQKARKFDIEKVGVPEAIPNGTMLDVVVGATRTDWAREVGIKTLPAKIWLGPEPDVAAHAERFLNELESVKPGTHMAHQLALKADRAAAKEVQNALDALPHCRSVGVFYRILDSRPTGADAKLPRANVDLLNRTVDYLRALKPEGGDPLPGEIVRAVAKLVDEGRTVADVWRGTKKGQDWTRAVDRARTAKANHGGAGRLHEYAANILEGRHRTTVEDKG